MNTFDRRTFLVGGFALAAIRGSAEPRVETFSEWLAASAKNRQRAMEQCLERIKNMDGTIRAWVHVAPRKATAAGKLSGIPFGAKDIIETKGLATEYGSPVYKGRIGTMDASIVRDLRQRGAVLLGKTHSTAFAYRTPGPTHNPRDLRHTPGGSSSGSAAAVAAGMVPFAIGTQTGGSVLRPASFCGVTGFKATYGLLSLEGVLPLAKSFDTLGFFTHTAADMLALWNAMGHPAGRAEEIALGVPYPMPEVDPSMAAAFRRSIARFREQGLSIRTIDIAGMLAKLNEAHRTVMLYEGGHFHEARYKQHGDRLADIATMVREGLQIPRARYDESLRFIAECKTKAAELYKATPAILVPAAPGPAPLGLESTGDSRMNAPWSALGTPAISIPMPIDSGLPLGLQITAARGEDARVIRTAIRLEQALR